MALHFRRATADDVPLLGALNKQLIQDQGHRNPMDGPDLEQRMRGWLAGEYVAILFENSAEVVAYALYREEPELIYLRHFFVQRPYRRHGLGKEAMQLLRTKIWPAGKRLTVEVLTANASALAFFKAAGFRDYAVTLEITAE